ncbi:FAD-dependent oxidoreductase domain-containing protein 1-like [Oopsacas minuta]|uniref:FAD-dependent oxidoreductase domain-containing protein 1 n=1 Tax=Oopsacas minuta TaxID=111878 RepID=A0AAV7KUH8_9METZ|nr:FAD-dependent oxidoreductase domain-containing protein 1-like [Oopsacas minuta]
MYSLCSKLLTSFNPTHCLIRWKHYDVTIVGGGIMGMSSAFFLSKRVPSSSICVLERDRTYSMASTPRSVGSIRQQFSLRENIQLSSYSFDFLQNINSQLRVDDPIDIGFTSGGYCFLATERMRDNLLENNKIQLENGAEVELIEACDLKQRFPWINPEGVSLASLGRGREGWFDPWLLLNAFKIKIHSLDIDVINDSNGSKSEITCSHLIIAAGAWSDSVIKMVNPEFGLPIRPRKRMVFVYKCKDFHDTTFPMLIDSSGVYTRREGTHDTFICGKSPDTDKDTDTLDLEVEYEFFDKEIWLLFNMH